MLTTLRRPVPGPAWRTQLYPLAVVALIATYLLAAALQQSNVPGGTFSAPAITSTRAAQALVFEANAGQTDQAVRFIAHAPGATIFFTESGLTMALKPAPAASASEGDVVSLAFVGAQAATLVAAGAALPARVNYFIGNDSAKWHTAVPVFAGIRYSNLYPGVSLQYEGIQGRLKGTYTLAAGADPAQIRWRYSGAGRPTVDGAGRSYG